MKIKHLVFFLWLPLFFSGSCKKGEDYDPQKQLAADEVLIKDFISKNNITAVRESRGVYYQIINPGSGSIVYTANTTVTANYTGRLLDGRVFDKTTSNAIAFKLGGVIAGWQIGVPLIQKGGKIRLLIPSVYGYGQNGQGAIPANSVLDFDIELADVQN